jgi:hypothetical protein
LLFGLCLPGRQSNDDQESTAAGAKRRLKERRNEGKTQEISKKKSSGRIRGEK